MSEEAKYPPLGDVTKTYQVVLTEPEINTVFAVHGFFMGMKAMHDNFPSAALVGRGWVQHYFETLEQLSKKLEVFDDGNAPRAEPM